MTEEAQSAANGSFKPPWMAFQTYWNFLGELAGKDLPPRIDRSLMSSKSGTDQANLLGALKTFGLINDADGVEAPLRALAVADEEQRKAELANQVEFYYADALALSRENGTQAQLLDVFRDKYGISGADTLRKSTTFFLQAARMAGIPLSPHFKQTRTGTAGGGGRSRAATKGKTKAKNGAEQHQGEQRQTPTEQHQVMVELKTGGTMTLSVSVNPLQLRGDDRSFFYDIVDKLTEYEEANAGSATSAKAPATRKSETATNPGSPTSDEGEE